LLGDLGELLLAELVLALLLLGRQNLRDTRGECSAEAGIHDGPTTELGRERYRSGHLSPQL
jgi:hypothetical protein